METWVNENINDCFESVIITKHPDSYWYELCISFKTPTTGLYGDSGNEVYQARSLKYAKYIYWTEWNNAKDRKRAKWIKQIEKENESVPTIQKQ